MPEEKTHRDLVAASASRISARSTLNCTPRPGHEQDDVSARRARQASERARLEPHRYWPRLRRRVDSVMPPTEETMLLSASPKNSRQFSKCRECLRYATRSRTRELLALAAVARMDFWPGEVVERRTYLTWLASRDPWFMLRTIPGTVRGVGGGVVPSSLPATPVDPVKAPRHARAAVCAHVSQATGDRLLVVVAARVVVDYCRGHHWTEARARAVIRQLLDLCVTTNVPTTRRCARR